MTIDEGITIPYPSTVPKPTSTPANPVPDARSVPLIWLLIPLIVATMLVLGARSDDPLTGLIGLGIMFEHLWAPAVWLLAAGGVGSGVPLVSRMMPSLVPILRKRLSETLVDYNHRGGIPIPGRKQPWLFFRLRRLGAPHPRTEFGRRLQACQRRRRLPTPS